MEVNVQRDYQPLFTLVQPLHTEMADKGAFTVYTATFTKFLACCKDSAKPCIMTVGTSTMISKVMVVLVNKKWNIKQDICRAPFKNRLLENKNYTNHSGL